MWVTTTHTLHLVHIRIYVERYTILFPVMPERNGNQNYCHMTTCIAPKICLPTYHCDSHPIKFRAVPMVVTSVCVGKCHKQHLQWKYYCDLKLDFTAWTPYFSGSLRIALLSCLPCTLLPPSSLAHSFTFPSQPCMWWPLTSQDTADHPTDQLDQCIMYRTT